METIVLSSIPLALIVCPLATLACILLMLAAGKRLRRRARSPQAESGGPEEAM